jgi:hypothetical protein
MSSRTVGAGSKPAPVVMIHALTGVNALLKMFYTTKEIIGNCPKMNRLQFVNAVIYSAF